MEKVLPFHYKQTRRRLSVLCTRTTFLAAFWLTSIATTHQSLAAAIYYVSPEGSAGAKGTQDNPVPSIGAALSAIKESGSIPGSTILLMDGVYHIETCLTIDASLSGTAEAPVTIRADHPGKAMLSAGVAIPQDCFQPLPDSPQKSLLQDTAKSSVLIAKLGGTPAGTALEQNPSALISCGPHQLTVARWPDKGYAHINQVLTPGAVWTSGRTISPKPESSFENPIGGTFTFHEKWNGNWNRELSSGISRPSVHGYFFYDWYLEQNGLASETNGTVQLVSDTRYGVGGTEKIPRRAFVSGLLSELTRPGEWFWEAAGKTFYLWPISNRMTVTVGRPIALLEIKNASFVRVEGLVFENGSQGITVTGGRNVTLAGCEVRNLSGTGITINQGRNHHALSCDIHHVNQPIKIQGTEPKDYRWNMEVNPPKLISDGHRISNNHIWECRNNGGINLYGVGIVVSHNLIHDLPGSAITWRGNDIVFEYNELYSVLKELGDWGVTYTGANWYSFGNILRYNFIHHVFSLPQAHPVNGFYYDDLDMGDTTFGNVFYKAGYRSVMINGGGAQRVSNNLFIKNYINVYQTGLYAEDRRAARAKFDSGELKRGDKTDYWWKTEQITGKDGWANPPWSTAYPDLKRVMELDPFNPVLTTISCNYEMQTIHQNVWLRNVPDGMINPEPMMKITDEAFQNPDTLNFSFKPDFQPLENFERIPFKKIGLVIDEFRKETPDKATYRYAVREQNTGRAPYDPDAIYNWETINDILYSNPSYWNLKPSYEK